MARPPRFSTDDILDAAALVASERWRDGTISDVARRLGAQPAAVYYRFPSKDSLFGTLWARSIERFHVGLHETMRLPEPQAALVECAAHIPVFCRQHPLDAVAMTLYRQPDLLAMVDGPLADRVSHINDAVWEGMHALTMKRFGRADDDVLQVVAVACLESPYGLVRRYLRGDVDMPAWLDDACRVSCAAILRLGDVEQPSAAMIVAAPSSRLTT